MARARLAIACTLAALPLAIVGASGAAPGHRSQVANSNVVIGQLNLWYYGAGQNGGFDAWDGSGRPMVKLKPLLGKYHSSDPRVVRRQIAWAADYGVDVFSIEWISPRGEPGSIEDNLDDAFLRAPNLCRVRWLIFYDFILRLDWHGIDFSNGVDFDDPKVRELFVGDLVHFARKYFGHPQYFQIDGRPVVYVYASWNYKGDVAGAVAEARARVRTLGYDLYLVGDELTEERFDLAHASIWDANTAFIPFLVPGAPKLASAGAAAEFVARSSAAWRDKIAGATVRGRTDPLVFQPGFTPQEDDRLFRKNTHQPNSNYVPARSRAEVERLARVALAYASRVGGDSQKLVWLNTFNNWAETTTVEPTATAGPRYPAGNYGFDMLRAVRKVFGGRTFGTGVRTCG